MYIFVYIIYVVYLWSAKAHKEIITQCLLQILLEDEPYTLIIENISANLICIFTIVIFKIPVYLDVVFGILASQYITPQRVCELKVLENVLKSGNLTGQQSTETPFVLYCSLQLLTSKISI